MSPENERFLVLSVVALFELVAAAIRRDHVTFMLAVILMALITSNTDNPKPPENKNDPTP